MDKDNMRFRALLDLLVDGKGSVYRVEAGQRARRWFVTIPVGA